MNKRNYCFIMEDIATITYSNGMDMRSKTTPMGIWTSIWEIIGSIPWFCFHLFNVPQPNLSWDLKR